jgi:8-oxo-dGTP pyrophosphatase MutT (NUDIX family)
MSNKTKKAQVIIAALDAKNKTFNFLLLQTNERRGQFWQNVTGKVEKDESYEDGALREAIEETAVPVELIVDMIDLGITHDFIDQRNRDVHEKAFLLILDSKWEIKLDPHEHQSFKWVNINELHKDLVKFAGNYEALAKASSILRHWGMM